MGVLKFFRGKKVLITGHTGFKGSWLCRILADAGAEVTGYSLKPPTRPSLFEIAGLKKMIRHNIGDIRDFSAIKKVFRKAAPEIVIHMAAQPIVRDGYKKPAYTYETNIMGTVNVLECLRLSGKVKSFLNVTTDKVYENLEHKRGYCEDDRLCGRDPYSNSKSCSELVTYSYAKSFFSEKGSAAVSTARSGNVIGGGDFAADRIIPDCVRAALKGKTIIVRNPGSIRPYQHVLECLSGYLALAEAQYKNPGKSGNYNFGPDDADCVTTGALAEIFCKAWGNGLAWAGKHDGGPHEAGLLKLDSTKAKTGLKWKPRWGIKVAVEKTVSWTKSWAEGGDAATCMDGQIGEYFAAG